MAELTDGTAELRVLVTTALGALPLENAIVSVSTAPDDTGMRTLLYSVTTDSGGMTPSMILTTPPRSNSLSPGSGPPFAVYTVEISAEGYTPLTALHIAMFSGVPTMLPVALTPLKENQSFAQYCNGTTVTCPGGLSQWGTVPLAEQGLSAEQILQSFYGSDINFVTGAPLSPNLGGSFPGVTLRLGDFSEDVRTIQTRLNRISTNFPNIPKIYPTDGVFNADTERAVRAFQRQFNLTEDGLVGPATWYRIAFIYNNVKRLSELNSEGLTLSEISRQYPERLTEGMSGPGVQLLQYFLAIVGEFYDALPRWQAEQIDGIFGPQTREAVAAYQRLVGLPITGVVDRETWYALLSTYQSVLLAQPEQEWLEEFIGLPETFLVKGMRGEAVRKAQQLINIIARGYAEVPAVTVDGIFGDATESSVSVIQSLLGLPTTGAIGPLTWEGMADLAETVLAGSQSARGQYPGYPVGEEAT